MRDQSQVAVVGVTGYSGLELARILLHHEAVRSPVFYVREPNGAKCLSELFPQFRGWGTAPVRPLMVETITSSRAGTVFLATPHDVSAELAPPLLDAGLRIVDLSGAFRFRSANTLSAWYKMPTPHADRLSEAAYGIPELYATEIASSRLVANPGCYATSVILGLRPLTHSGWVAKDSAIVCDCKSGASGAGKDLRKDLHFVEVDENFKAYGLFTHRHTPEILEHTGWSESQLVFSTHLLPLARGILSTIYVTLGESRTAGAVEALFRAFYAGRPMVRIWPAGSLPELQHVAHTNFCDIGFVLDKSGNRLIVVSCLDNLGKGAAGQAVQNFNLMIGLEEQIALQRESSLNLQVLCWKTRRQSATSRSRLRIWPARDTRSWSYTAVESYLLPPSSACPLRANLLRDCASRIATPEMLPSWSLLAT
jgi:N-acetyl-gamma-glutamyl-phosphate reductase